MRMLGLLLSFLFAFLRSTVFRIFGASSSLKPVTGFPVDDQHGKEIIRKMDYKILFQNFASIRYSYFESS